MKIMRELGLFAPNMVFGSLITAAISGILYIGLIPLVLLSMEKLQGLELQGDKTYFFLGIEVAKAKPALAFFILCVLILIMRTLSQVLLIKVCAGYAMKVRQNMYARIAGLPIDALERIGGAKILAVMTNDVARVIEGAANSPVIMVNLITAIGMLFYVFLVNDSVFYFILIIVGFGIVTYQIPMIWASKHYGHLGQAINKLQQLFHGIVWGAKELKLSRVKSDGFISHELMAAEKDIKTADLKANIISVAAWNYGSMICFFGIGLLSFVFINYHKVSDKELVASVMILLYIAAPISNVLLAITPVLRAKISLNNLNSIFDDMASQETCVSLTASSPQWNSISFKDITYSHKAGDGFKIGPINLEIKKGEITFIVGGNGSGKSTFSKIITQHYYPDSGEIYFDDVRITKENIQSYRKCISAVYSDYYLFRSIYDTKLNTGDLEKKINELLTDLGLSEKVSFDGRSFSSIKLSDGQRRRLALLTALIEDKELYLFDEWAADQDPAFREIYYKKILMDLKSRDKAVVAITHDDRYFHLADKIIRFEAGKSMSLVCDQG